MNIQQESNNNLVVFILSSAQDLNGTSPAGCRMDGGRHSINMIQDCLGELAKRIGQDPSLKTDAQLQPLFAALGTVHDITDSRAVAKAVGHLPMPNYIKAVTPAKPHNPFK